MNDGTAPRLVRPDIQQQNIGILPGETLRGRFHAGNMRDAKLARALGFEQPAQPARLPGFTDQEDANRVSTCRHLTTS
jgi:hypothetical protein